MTKQTKHKLSQNYQQEDGRDNRMAALEIINRTRKYYVKLCARMISNSN